MKKLVALLAAIGAVLFFWRKKHHEEEAPAWGSDTASSWGESPSSKPSDTAEAASDAVDETT